MFRKIVAIDKGTTNGLCLTTESYYAFGLLIYRRDVIVVLP